MKRKWLWTGGLRASLFGFGICCLIECGFLKHSEAPWYQWVLLGTLSLIITILGLVFLIKAGLLEEKIKNKNE
nr:hypothetical protein [Allomuricauda sp.]